MKYIAFYLPQFHEIPENNEMWGKGFTEWTNVKKAKPLFKDHFQPVIPYNSNYYDLTDPSVYEWQINLAMKYGIYGFCFYHYWYNGHIIMNKPIERVLKDEKLAFPFCICWANHDWSFSWVSKEDTVIYRQDYSDRKEWRNHYEYLLPYLKDNRYICIDGKPLLVIYEAARIPEMPEMLSCWNDWAIEDGFENGISFAYESVYADTFTDFDGSVFDYDIEYQPQYARVLSVQRSKTRFRSAIQQINDKTIKWHPEWLLKHLARNKLTMFDYDDIWNRILTMNPVSEKSIPGAFVNIDTTPRRQERGIVATGMTPEKLERYLIKLINKCKDEYHKDMIFVYAWNEWAEGAYMEPDERWKFGVLDAFRNSLIKTGELSR